MEATLRTIEKLGHGLQEVRQRALMQINTKLEHELITIQELNASPDFARRLLEWFNYPAPTNTKLILKLILDSVHICGDTFVSLGGIDFFNALKHDLDSDDQRNCDVILNELSKYSSDLTPDGSCVTTGNRSFQNLKGLDIS
jgi:hypothetical protein